MLHSSSRPSDGEQGLRRTTRDGSFDGSRDFGQTLGDTASVGSLPGRTMAGSSIARGDATPSGSWARSSRSSNRYSAHEDDDEDGSEPGSRYDHSRGTIEEVDLQRQPSRDGMAADHFRDKRNNGNTGTSSSAPTASSSGGGGGGGSGGGIAVTATAGIGQRQVSDGGTSETGGGSNSGSSGGGNGGGGNNRVEEVLPDGRRIIRYRNGTVKEVEPDGGSLVRFANGDTKRVDAASGTTIYYYALAQTTHTTYRDGVQIYEFPNKQVRMDLQTHTPFGTVQ